MQLLRGEIWNLSLIRRLIAGVSNYLEYWKPEYVVAGAYDDDHERRLRFYSRQLGKLGYQYLHDLDDDDLRYFKCKELLDGKRYFKHKSL